MVVFKRNQIVTIALVCMLILAGYLNFIYMDKDLGAEGPVVNISEEGNGEEIENYGEAKFVSSSKDAKADYFTETKLNKDKARSEALSLLKSVAENPASTPESKQEAQQKIINMAKNVENEGNIENILMGKGFSEISVTINEDNATVAVMTEGLSASEVAQIRDVVITEAKIGADKIKIMEIK